MRTQLWRIAVVLSAVIVLGGCRGHESITGGYGDRVVVGEVTMSAGVTINSPAGSLGKENSASRCASSR